MNKKSIIPSIISVIAAIICVAAAVSIIYIKKEPMSFDLMAGLVGLLSTLVTVLIGWQIFNYIFMKEEMEKRMSSIVKESFDDFFPVLMGCIEANSGDSLTVPGDERSFDFYFECLNKVSKTKNAKMSYFAVKFIANKMSEAINDMSKGNRKGILVGKRRFYLSVLEKFNHEDVYTFVDYVKEAEEVSYDNDRFARTVIQKTAQE